MGRSGSGALLATFEFDSPVSPLKALAMAPSVLKRQIFLARIVAVLLVAFLAGGLLWYGVSAEVHGRFWRNLMDRPGGPVAFRFVLQPIIAAILAFRDGVNDAKLGRSPYLCTIVTSSIERGARLREGLIATARVIFLGLCMEGIYQAIVLKTFYPGEAVFVAIVLAFVPYLLLRGPFARVARWRIGSAPRGERE